MKIIVCMKQVPNTAEVKIDPIKNTLIREGVPSIINPDDKVGLEVALRIKDSNPEVSVTVVSMGPIQATEALREALAMGADEAILLSDRAFGGADTWATSTTIAGALKNIDFDLIITGRQAIDGDTAQVGPQIAEHLSIPQVSYVEDVQVQDKNLIVRRQFEDRYHVLKLQMPCLITVLSELGKPRHMSIKGIKDAFTKEIKIWNLENIKDNIIFEHIGLKGSPTKVIKAFPKKGKGEGVKFQNLNSDEAVDKIIEVLEEKHII